MFSGCGGFDLGAHQSGKAEVVWANDNDAAAVETYRSNLGPTIEAGDVRDLEPPETPCDILLAGPPCQDYSVLWLHEGARTARAPSGGRRPADAAPPPGRRGAWGRPACRVRAPRERPRRRREALQWRRAGRARSIGSSPSSRSRLARRRLAMWAAQTEP
ncbi:MAG: DNA cytosine methyltransferase, partial [Actinobacteria bacterium]|nr:DNA cytosine methyltransferase [Actinomycetota bacterium]